MLVVAARIAFGLVSAISFCVSMYLLLWRDSGALASVSAALFMASALLFFLPELDTIKAFGVEGKLRARLSEADDLLLKLRTLATVNARLAYQQLTWLGKWGSPSAAMKQQLATEVDGIVKDLGLNSQSLLSPKNEYLRSVLGDLAHHFSQLVTMRARTLANDIWRANASSPDPATSKTVSELQELAQAVDRGLRRDERFEAFVERCLPPQLFPDVDLSKMKAFGRHLTELAAAAETSGQVPKEALDLLDDVGETPVRRYREIFGEEPRQ